MNKEKIVKLEIIKGFLIANRWKKFIGAMTEWGIQHRQKIKKQRNSKSFYTFELFQRCLYLPYHRCI